MAGMYPDNETISLFGEEVSWPGLDEGTGKFTSGDFSNPMKKPSFIPAETVNLILDNLANLITSLGGSPDNSGADQLKIVFENVFAKIEGQIQDLSASLLNRLYPVGTIYESVANVSPAEFLGGTWTVWGSGRVPVGVNTADGNFSTAGREGGAAAHMLTQAQMPSHTHIQDQHNHTQASHTHNAHTGSVTRAMNASSVTTGVFSRGGERINDNSNGATQDNMTLFINATHNSVTPTINNTTSTNQNTGDGSAHNNLQPYITRFAWVRTA